MKNPIVINNDDVKTNETNPVASNYAPKEANDHVTGSLSTKVSKALSGVFATLAVSVGAVGSMSLLPTTSTSTTLSPSATLSQLSTTEYGVYYVVETPPDVDMEGFSIEVSNYFVNKKDVVTAEEITQNGFVGEITGLKPNMKYTFTLTYDGETIAKQTVQTKAKTN